VRCYPEALEGVCGYKEILNQVQDDDMGTDIRIKKVFI